MYLYLVYLVGFSSGVYVLVSPDNLGATSCSVLQVTNLAWGAAAFADGYKRTNNSAHVADLVKWGADFLVSSWNNQAQAFVAVLGNNSVGMHFQRNDEAL
jgi:hypothetical protein